MIPLPKDLATAGFAQASQEIVYRLLVGSQGLDKTGKSQFWMTAPGPIAGINLDIGLEGVIHKYSKDKAIWVASFNVPPIDETGRSVSQNAYGQIFNKTKNAYYKALAHKDVRTVVVDTGSDWWEIARLAEFGSLAPAADIKRAYQSLNQLFRSLIRAAYDTDKNLIITHKVKEKWINKAVSTQNGTKNQDVWDGTYKRSGFGEEGYLIQVNIEHFRSESGNFGIRVQNCRQNMSIAGFELGPTECTFADLATLVFEGTTKQEWQ